MNPIVILERREGFSVPMYLSAEIATRFNLSEGETVSQAFANQLRDAAHYYELGRNAAYIEMLDKMRVPVAVVEH